MKKVLKLFFWVAIILLTIFIFVSKILPGKIVQVEPKEETSVSVDKEPAPLINKELAAPLEKARERVTKKPFGIFIVPENSPVWPERFSGYHTGTDFEVFSEELDAEIPVRAVCSGKLRMKKIAAGYGGLAIQDCFLEKNPITVIYGHLKLDSIKLEAGADLKVGDILGILGKGQSPETDGERKHLHLGFYKGKEINILGYIKNKNALADWIDPCQSVCQD